MRVTSLFLWLIFRAAITDHCDSTKEVRCGHDTEECVNTLLLCDGQNDCHNGWDEDSKTCSGKSVNMWIPRVSAATAH
jgi:hypothetical protein